MGVFIKGFPDKDKFYLNALLSQPARMVLSPQESLLESMMKSTSG